jgi:glutamate synthase (NADPH/NADH) small chain
MPGRRTHQAIASDIAAAKPPLTPAQALVQAERCHYCHDAPCVTACPTGIDIPSFIARIAQGNLRGAASAILEANPLGGMCARVCPTEVLCEDACVRHTLEDKPVEIGLLQRHATDALFAKPGAPLFTRAERTGRRVAVVGAGPAGLACAHGLARAGHDVVVFEARTKGGGLNEYGIASYKATGDFAQAELDWLLSIGGIELRTGVALGDAITTTPCSWASGWPASTRWAFLSLAPTPPRAWPTRWTSLPSCGRRVTCRRCRSAATCW